MFKNRSFSLFFLVAASLLLAACSPTLPAQVEVTVSGDNQSALVEFTGLVETITPDQWVIQGYNVNVSPQTELKGSFSVGDNVHVHAVVETDGKVTATEIEAFLPAASTEGPGLTSTPASTNGSEAEFIGIVESIAPDSWIISGQTFLVGPMTEIKDPIIVGDAVKIHAYTDENKGLVAREIELAIGTVSVDLVPNADEMELYGTVDAITQGSWQVSGISFAVNTQTEIKNVIALGDQVKVHLMVNADKTLTAREIELVLGNDPQQPVGMLELVGLVQSIKGNSWTVAGKVFLVSPQTEVKGAIVVGDLVKVEAMMNPDATLSAIEIYKAVDDNSNSDLDSSDDNGNDDNSGHGSDSEDDSNGKGGDDTPEPTDDDSLKGNG